MTHPLHFVLPKHAREFYPIIPFDPKQQKLAAIDLSNRNTNLNAEIFSDPNAFTRFIDSSLEAAGATMGYGGYLENREIYSHLPNFNNRTYHLGVDIWAPSGTRIFAPWGGTIHSMGYHTETGDYGATLILQHQLDGLVFYTLYGHLSKGDLGVSGENEYISFGDPFAEIGRPEENGNWPPHLHFQIIIDMELRQGDFPGVCSKAELPFYRNNCPDPDLMLNWKKWL